MEAFIASLELQRPVFRSDHASNRSVLKGTLGTEKARLLREVEFALDAGLIAAHLGAVDPASSITGQYCP
jgi:hypothetical protein